MISKDVQPIKLNELDLTSFVSLASAVSYILNEGQLRSGFAIAINAEKMVSAINNEKVMEVLKSGTLRYADGIAIVWAMKQKGITGKRIAGCDLWTNLMIKSVLYQTPVYIVGSSSEVNSAVAEKLRDQGVNLVGHQDGFFEDENEIFNSILSCRPKIVSVAMGSPAQELFISKCREVWPDAFYMGVGGTYDVFVGKVKRAPIWMQQYHLEWAYRLIKQPVRIFRQANLLKFMWLYVNRKL